MGILDRFRTDPAAFAAAYRDTSTLENPSSDLVAALSAFDDGTPSSSGVTVSPQKALRSIAVYAAVRVLAESVASLPVDVLKRDGKSRVRVENDPRERLLSQEPNPYVTAETYWSTLMTHTLLTGNGYGLVSRDGRGRPSALYLLDPFATAPYRRKKRRRDVLRQLRERRDGEFRLPRRDSPSGPRPRRRGDQPDRGREAGDRRVARGRRLRGPVLPELGCPRRGHHVRGQVIYERP